MADTTNSPTTVNNTEPPSTIETKTPPLTANVATTLLLRSLQRGQHNIDDPKIVLQLQLHESDDLFVWIGENETLWGWVEDKAKFVYGSGDAAVSASHAYYLRFSYDSRTSTFVIRTPVAVHESFEWRVVSWIQNRLDAIADSDAQSKPFVQDIINCGSWTLLIKPPGKECVVISHTPDSQFMYASRYWRTVVIELANSTGPKSLSGLAHDYILQSRGNIRTVCWV